MKTISLVTLLAGAALLLACAESNHDGGDTQTNWLKACSADSECGSLACLCGICSRPCTAESDCVDGPAGVGCQPSDSEAALAACGSAPSAGMCLEPLAQEPSALDFCAEFHTALCDHVGGCGCGGDAALNCRAQLESCATDAFFAELSAGVMAGSYVYDAEAAAALVARIRSPGSSCDSWVAATGFDTYSAHSFGRVFRGTLTEGSACEPEDDKKYVGATVCAEGLLCLPDTSGSNRCVAIAAPGDACPVVAAHPDSSCLERRPPDSDEEFESSYRSIVCVPDGAGSTTGTCERLAPDGTACNNHEQCASGRCRRSSEDFSLPGTCAAQVTDGETCSESPDCESGRCVFNGPATCAPKYADGVACTSNEDCSSDFCDASGGSSSEMGICGSDPSPEPLMPGSPCSADDDCDRSSCAQGVCLERICRDYLN
jgi:hypothetical protein